MAKARDFKFCTLVYHVMFLALKIQTVSEWVWSRSSDIFKFWEICDNNSKTVQDRRTVIDRVAGR